MIVALVTINSAIWHVTINIAIWHATKVFKLSSRIWRTIWGYVGFFPTTSSAWGKIIWKVVISFQQIVTFFASLFIDIKPIYDKRTKVGVVRLDIINLILLALNILPLLDWFQQSKATNAKIDFKSILWLDRFSGNSYSSSIKMEWRLMISHLVAVSFQIDFFDWFSLLLFAAMSAFIDTLLNISLQTKNRSTFIISYSHQMCLFSISVLITYSWSCHVKNINDWLLRTMLFVIFR